MERAAQDLGIPAWLRDGPDCDIVISSRTRIARNLCDHPFPHRLSGEERAEVARRVERALPELRPVRLGELSPERRDALAAARLAPIGFVSSPEGCLLVDHELRVSVLANEEDHVRIQAFQPGSRLVEAAGLAARIEATLAQNLRLAWNKRYGHLTASPVNCGSGVRVSSLCHLPGLATARRLSGWLRAASDARVTMRGVFGEGTRAVGAFFQLSVVAQRDETPEDAARRLLAVVCLLADEERSARRKAGPDEAAERAAECGEFVDRAERVTLGEALRVLSWVRLAAAWEGVLSARRVDAWSAEILIDRWRQVSGGERRRAEALRNWLGRV